MRRAAVTAVLAVALFAACSDDRPAVDPGEADDGFVGARADVTDETCARDGDQWRAGGTVTNPLGAAADYRIYVSYEDASGETLEVVQVDVTDVDAGDSEQWSDEVALDAQDVRCVLRVERVEVR